MSDPKREKEEDNDEVEEDYDPEAPVVGNWKLCDLPEVPVVTGEEEEEVVWKARSKIYRWRGEWKERYFLNNSEEWANSSSSSTKKLGWSGSWSGLRKLTNALSTTLYRRKTFSASWSR